MNRRTAASIAWILLISLTAAFVLASVAESRLLGNRDYLDPVLKQLVSPLHQRGIDVVAGETSKLKTSTRPRVAMLSGMPSPMPADFTLQPWMKDFVEGLTKPDAGFVAGVKSNDPRDTSKSKEKFLDEWRSKPLDKRVFLSFTADDAAVAQRVAVALRKIGYATFVFTNSANKAPTFDAQLTGKIFAEAGHHMVVDSKEARRSHGVWFEARATASKGEVGPFPVPDPLTPAVYDPSFSENEFRSGLRKGWVVTENEEGTIFVHQFEAEGMLIGMLYRVRVTPNGLWTVHDAQRSRGFDRPLATLVRPKGLTITKCTCR